MRRREPLRLAVVEERGDGGDLSILLGPAGAEVDILPALERLVVEMSGQGVYVTMTLQAVVDAGSFSFDVDRVAVTVPTPDVTAEEINEVLLSKGMSESPGEAIAGWLASRRR